MIHGVTGLSRGRRRPEAQLLTAGILLLSSCGGGGVETPPPPPPPPGITVTVMPQASNVPLGGRQPFNAAVTGSSDTGVIWQVNGNSPGTAASGTVDANGAYTAPRTMPSPAAVTVTAVSHADPTRGANAAVTITSDVAVAVQPGLANVELGAAQPFSAQITGSGNPLGTVRWTLAGAGCSGAACGQISAGGAYTAPHVLPFPPTVTLTATSDADPSRMNLATVTITSQFTIAMSGPASVNPSATVQFNALITPLAGSNPSTAMIWMVSGAGCAGAGNPCGTVTNLGFYTAPSAAPQPNSITIKATSVADPNKSASTTTQLITQAGITVSPSGAQVALEHTQQFTAMVSGLSNPAVQWYVNNLLGGDPNTVGTISNAVSSGLYQAPVNMVAGRQVTVTAKSVTNSSVAGSTSVVLTSKIVVQVTPPSSSRITGARQTFTAAVTNTSNPNVEWTVNGTPNGSATVGQICVTGSNPCLPPPLSVAPGSVDYLAPPAVPSSATVTVEAVSVADTAQFGSASVTILAQISVSLSPPSATLPPTGTQAFLATVAGSPDQNVTWDVNGSRNGALNVGVICLPGSNPCQAPAGPAPGPIEYRAPATPPSPNTVAVRATSELGATISQSAAVTIGNGPFLFSLLPASVTTSVTQPFALRVEGVQFTAGGSGSGSTVLLDGVPKTTNCPSVTECDITMDPVDVATAGAILVSIENPGAPPAPSNTVRFVAVPPDNSEDIIPLDAGNPLATGKDIVVVEPTTAGGTPSTALSLQAIGVFDSVNNVCRLGASVVTATRPVTGSVPFNLCLVGTNLSAVNAVTFSEPVTGDIAAGSLSSPAGTLILAFTLTVPASAQPGLRSVFASGVNSDRAALTGSLEVK